MLSRTASQVEGEPKAAPLHYLVRQGPLRIIFGSFFVLVVPLFIVQLVLGRAAAPLVLVYVLLTGITHFAVTYVVFLAPANRAYFRSSTRNVVLYFGVPAMIFALIAVASILGLYPMVSQFPPSEIGADRPQAWIVALFWVHLVVRGYDFFHVLRQSFGVLELFKSQASVRVAAASRGVGWAFFLFLWAAQVITLVSGGQFQVSLPMIVALSIAGALFAVNVTLHAIAWRAAAGNPSRWVPLGYFVMQSTCALLPVYAYQYYFVSLAVHYVEYHVLIQRRAFGAPSTGAREQPDPERDGGRRPVAEGGRLIEWLGQHQEVFYALIIVVALTLGVLPRTLGGSGVGLLLFILMNTMIVNHFYLDALIWRFRNPFYRSSLGVVLFAPAARR